MRSSSRFLIPLSLLLLGALLAPAGAAPAERTETVAYDGPDGLIVEGADTQFTMYTISTDNVATLKGERFVAVEVTDDSGEPIAAAVHQGNQDLGTTCGSGGDHLELVNRKPVHVHLVFGPSVDCGTASMPTTGTVELTFHR